MPRDHASEGAPNHQNRIHDGLGQVNQAFADNVIVADRLDSAKGGEKAALARFARALAAPSLAATVVNSAFGGKFCQILIVGIVGTRRLLFTS